jgi:D-glycerate 3-kinase
METLGEQNLNVAVTGLDDVYLNFEDQEKLRNEHPGNKLWEGRGVTGTHDVELGTRTFDALETAQRTFVDSLASGASDASKSIEPVRLPRYDKNAHNGRGDRLPISSWPAVSPPIDVVIFEGWLNGFRALPPEQIAAIHASADSPYVRHHALEHVLAMNDALKTYEVKWWSRFDCSIHLRALDYKYSYGWRWEAEQKANGPLTREQIGKFVDRFMPMNELYMENLVEWGMWGAEKGKEGRHLQITIDQTRKMVGHKLM